jgi:hypothetical protein
MIAPAFLPVTFQAEASARGMLRYPAGMKTRHLHMANPEGRVFPRTRDEYDYAIP